MKRTVWLVIKREELNGEETLTINNKAFFSMKSAAEYCNKLEEEAREEAISGVRFDLRSVEVSDEPVEEFSNDIFGMIETMVHEGRIQQ